MIVVDDVDTILRRLSVAYLDETVAVASTELERHLGRRVKLRPAFFHPAKNNWLPDCDPTIHQQVPHYDRWGPFGGLGWLDVEFDTSGFIDADDPYLLTASGRSLCDRLLRASPSLCIAGGGRWSHAKEGAMTSEEQLAALLADNEHDWTAWMPLPGRTDDPVDRPWQRARAAADKGDAVELRDALAEARGRYSPAGIRALTAGVLHLLLLRLAAGETTTP